MNDFPALRDPLVIVFPRDMVEACEIKRVLDLLQPLAHNATAVREHTGRLEFVFSGYDHDPRELYGIPEVREFVRDLTERFPYWFHYCNKVDASLFVLMACLLPIDTARNVGGEVVSHFARGSLSQVLLQLFTGMNSLYAQHSLSAEENAAMTKLVGSYVNAYLGE
jgi:hypothetical protein